MCRACRDLAEAAGAQRTADRQSRILAARNQIRASVAAGRAGEAARVIGDYVDQKWQDLAVAIGAGRDVSPIVRRLAAELPAATATLLRREVEAAWVRSMDTWRGVLTPAQALQANQLATGKLREDRLDRKGSGNGDGENPVQIFRAPDAAKVDAWIKSPNWVGDGKNWEDRLEVLSRKITDKGGLADQVTRMYAAGAKPAEIEREIRPLVSGLKVSATRIVRTETLRVAEEAQRETYRQLDSLIDGYRIFATMDDRTRPEHAARNGTFYPKDACPLVPDEPNCRCWSTPVLRNADDTIPPALAGRIDGPIAVVNGVVQDRDEWRRWFDAQTPARQRIVIGADRMAAARDVVGNGKVQWAAVSGPDGHMLPSDAIRAQTRVDIEARALAWRMGEPPAGKPASVADLEGPPVLDVAWLALVGAAVAGAAGVGGAGVGVGAGVGGGNLIRASVPVPQGVRIDPALRAAMTVNVATGRAGSTVARAINRLTPRMLATAEGAWRMYLLVTSPASRATEAQRDFWLRRAARLGAAQAQAILRRAGRAA